MTKVVAVFYQFLIAGSLLAAPSIQWKTSEIEDMPCENPSDFRFNGGSQFSHGNALFFLWANHYLEGGSPGSYRSQLQQYGFTNFEFVRGDSSGGPVAALMSNDNMIAIIFRGSRTLEDAFVDSRFLQRASKTNSIRGRIHRGILDYYNELKPELDAALEALKPQGKKVYFTGHSLGGALAQLAATSAAKSGLAIEAVYTSATPRIGDAEFLRDAEISLPNKIYTLVTDKDVVPHIPPSQWLSSDFAKIQFNGRAVSLGIQKIVEDLNFDVTPGSIVFIPRIGPSTFHTGLQKIDLEKKFWNELREQLEPNSF